VEWVLGNKREYRDRLERKCTVLQWWSVCLLVEIPPADENIHPLDMQSGTSNFRVLILEGSDSRGTGCEDWEYFGIDSVF